MSQEVCSDLVSCPGVVSATVEVIREGVVVFQDEEGMWQVAYDRNALVPAAGWHEVECIPSAYMFIYLLSFGHEDGDDRWPSRDEAVDATRDALEPKMQGACD